MRPEGSEGCAIVSNCKQYESELKLHFVLDIPTLIVTY